jgi:hypothetical protein
VIAVFALYLLMHSKSGIGILVVLVPLVLVGLAGSLWAIVTGAIGMYKASRELKKVVGKRPVQQGYSTKSVLAQIYRHKSRAGLKSEHSSKYNTA